MRRRAAGVKCVVRESYCWLPHRPLLVASVLRPVRPDGFVEPCLPTLATRPPAGPGWVHEIKHDGYRLIVRRDGATVRLFTRGGYDWTDRFPVIVTTAGKVRAKSFTIDGEVVVCDPDGLAVFEALQTAQRWPEAFLYAFDLVELDGADLRSKPFGERKARLTKLLANRTSGIVLNEHIEAEGAAVFAAACRIGLEGIVSKHLELPYRSGRATCWIKTKNPQHPAMRRVREARWWRR